jgi:DNA sulfur modification protein DndD
MILKTLTLNNFMPYKGLTSLNFPTDKDRNVMLVYGDNMRGKTSLLNGLRWVFYGGALGRHSRPIPLFDLVNKEAASEGDWTMEACITFEADGHNYELRRRATRRLMVTTPSRSEDFEVLRALSKDGIPLGDHQIDAEINRYAPEQISRFFLFDGELLQEYESLLIDGSEQGKKIKDAIEQVLGVPTLIRGRDDAQTILKSAQKQQSADLQRIGGFEIQTQKQKLLQAQIEALEEDLKRLNSNLKSTRNERLVLEDFLDKTESVYQAKERVNAAQKLERANAERQISLSFDRLGFVKDAWRELIRTGINQKRGEIYSKHDELTTQMLDKNKAETKIAQLRQAITTDTCQACGQSLHHEQKELAGKEIATLEATLKNLSVDMTSMQHLAAQIQNLDKLLKPSNASQIEFIDRDLARLRIEQTKYDNEIETLTDIIKGQDTAEISRKRALRDSLLKEETRIEEDIKKSQSSIEKDRNDLAIISRALENNPQARTARSSKVVNLSSALERVYTRSIDRLREDLKTKVESLASDAFKKLTTQTKYSGLRINSNYGLTILDERNQEVTIRSAGAEQIVALSLIDGLIHAGRSAGPVVMDTPFGRLDPKHRANILTYLPTTAQQLVLFVHEGEINKTTDLRQIAQKIGCVYEIKEVNPRHSKIERVTQ